MCTRVPDLPKGSDKQRFGRSPDTNRSGFLNAHALEPRNRSTTSNRVSDVRIKLHIAGGAGLLEINSGQAMNAAFKIALMAEQGSNVAV
uniref:Uncharacterized protein n=1 Tax=Oryza barthii TaxID=65489 RepID=A0A0D3FCZ6_9ORYZ